MYKVPPQSPAGQRSIPGKSVLRSSDPISSVSSWLRCCYWRDWSVRVTSAGITSQLGVHILNLFRTGMAMGSAEAVASTATTVAAAIPMHHGLLLAAILFVLGMVGILVRRNLIFIL